MRAAAVIPAYNEEQTVAAVVEAARQAGRIADVVVVDNSSTDGTAEAAREAGARVVACPEVGKGQAMATGVAATSEDVIVFLDADLVGLLPSHVDRLAGSVLSGRVGMACGLFDRGPLLNPVFLHVLPILTGQRAVRRDLFTLLHDQDQRGYKIEAALNSLCSDLGVTVDAFVCSGLWHRTKEQKYPTAVEGFVRKQGMLLTAM
ncbi:MAG TPA: glycosyltransferase, partial [Acidimicrobiia bacterium]|nr:glycosyltransferase [Acidimicrobiia bacterium]